MTEQRDLPEVKLPGALGDIARVAGREAAEKIGRKFGGVQVYFPARPRPDHWLTQLVGEDAALAIGEELTGGFSGGARIDLPTGSFGQAATKQAEADQMIREGKSERDIALATGYTSRTVRRRRAKLLGDRDSRQGSFFED